LIKTAWNIFFDGAVVEDLVSYFVRFVTGYGILAIWFLSSYFIARLCFLCIWRFDIKFRCLIVTLIIALSYVVEIIVVKNTYGIISLKEDSLLYYLCIGISRGLACTFFIEIGYDLAEGLNQIFELKQRFRLLISIGLMILDYVLMKLNGSVNFSCLQLGSYPFLIYISAVIGSIGFIILIYSLFENHEIKILSYLSKNSLIILCTHMTFMITTLSRVFTDLIFGGITRYGTYIRDLVAVFLVLCVELPIIYIVNNYMPFMIGKPAKNNDNFLNKN